MITTTIQRDESPATRPGSVVCGYIGCDEHAVSLVLAGATRVPACIDHEREWVERYPEEAWIVWPI